AQQHALWALDAIDPHSVVGVATFLTRMSGSPSTSAAVVRQAIRWLGERRSLNSASALLARSEDDDASIRFRSATALGRIADTNSVAALTSRLMDSDAFVRFAVFTALNRIGRANGASWPAIAQGLESGNPRVREGT